ncbi:DUF262 domain-containing protein [Haladaptatus sp. W1]|uniref:DUF262 domain-containing protein n=1 Tax=Haladaptatus sp. W1 TaxID=1897478 RepID=UPI0009F63185|nr:DUF262 domain-containing protein [Haladaptatus sp. W1]
MDIDATESTVQGVFANKSTYTVPDYQRPYSWEKEQWKDFWTDLNTIKGTTHFLGSIVLIKHDQGFNQLAELEVVDGQQRLTTISLLFRAMQSQYDNVGDPNSIKELIDDEYLFERDDSNNKHAKLSLSQYDGGDYEHILEGRRNAVEDDSNLLQALKYFEEKLADHTADELDDLRARLTKQMTIVVVECDTPGSAFRLFETLNNRGMELSSVDLMKNSLLQTATQEYGNDSKEYNHVRSQWEYLLKNVVHQIDHPNRFFRHFIMSREVPDYEGNVSSRKLYDVFNEMIDTRLDAAGVSIVDYVDEMVDISDTYLGIIDASIDKYSGKQSKKVNARLRNLNDIESSHSRTLILRSIDEFDNSTKTIEILRLLESFMTRWRVADLTTGASLDRIFSGLCSTAFNSTDPIDVIRTRLEEESPGDDEFKAKFANSGFKHNSMTRYILDTLERVHYSTGGGKTYDRASVDIEHIAPQAALSADKYRAWRDVIDVGEAKYKNQYRNRIGNLTLLEESLNEEASANPFQQKKDQYRLSDFKMTEHVRSNYSEWTTDTIDQRSEELAEIAVDIWSFKLETYNSKPTATQ